MRTLILCWLLGSVVAVDAEAVHARVLELMAELPEPVQVEPQAIKPLVGDVPMVEGVAITQGQRVVLSGITLFEKGPVDGLEVLCCLEGGKNHESLARLLTGNAQLVKAAFIAALGIEVEGKPASEMSAVPARGLPLAVDAVWQPDPLLQPGKWVRAPASCLIRDRHTDRAYPPLPYVYTGSRFSVYDQVVPGTDEVKRVERFMLSVTLSVAVQFDEPDALLAAPYPTAAQDDLFEVNSKIAPPVESPIKLVFTRAELPLTLRLDPDGTLHHGDARLDDAALADLLVAHYGPDAQPGLYAVEVTAPFEGDGAVSDQVVVDCRARVMAQAAEVGVWVVPVYRGG